MNTSLSAILHDYYQRERATLATEPAVRSELETLGVGVVTAAYDGVGDSGQIDEIAFLDGPGQLNTVVVTDDLRGRVEALLYAVLELRHGGWENNDGAFGSFRWNVTDGSVEHEHNQRYTDVETSTYEGFEDCKGRMP